MLGGMFSHRVRERLEDREEGLSPFGQRSRNSQGRAAPDEPSFMRTEFQRDRDRIVHSKSFRRLKHKTQVFIAPVGDHYVTRLTHTLEVSQVARSVARALNLNEDLVEAMALGHDVGHPPFGHLGEEVLDGLFPEGFRHAEHGLRVVERLEKEGEGLNLTWEVRQGILHHSKGRTGREGAEDVAVQSLEAQVCRLADGVAYINHDIGDAVRAGLVREGELPERALRVLGRRHSERLNTLIGDVVEQSWAATGEVAAPEGETPGIRMSSEVAEAAQELREFLFERVYLPSSRNAEGERARRVVKALYRHFVTHPGEIPRGFALDEDGEERRAVDYIAGMTDHYALRLCEAIS